MVKNHLQCRRPRSDSWVEKVPWRRAWQPTPVFFPGESHGQRRLAGYNPEGLKDSDSTEATQHFLTSTLKNCSGHQKTEKSEKLPQPGGT